MTRTSRPSPAWEQINFSLPSWWICFPLFGMREQKPEPWSRIVKENFLSLSSSLLEYLDHLFSYVPNSRWLVQTYSCCNFYSLKTFRPSLAVSVNLASIRSASYSLKVSLHVQPYWTFQFIFVPTSCSTFGVLFHLKQVIKFQNSKLSIFSLSFSLLYLLI